MSVPQKFFASLLLAVLPGAAFAQFADTFGSINSAWVTDRHDPAGFESVSFLGDNRLNLTIQPPAESDAFQNTQGRHRTTAITGLRKLNSDIFNLPSIYG